MPTYIAERQVAFDPTTLGFPSISNCQAVVFVTANGLYGLHALGGQTGPSLDTYKGRFNDFIRGPVPNRTGTRLYGVTFARGNRYVGAPGHDFMADWRTELRAYATDLGYTGKIRGYDLTNAIANPPNSAYVEFRKSGDKCEIFVKVWTDADKAVGPVASSLTHRTTAPGNPALLSIVGNVVTNVTTANLQRVHSVRLRG